MATDTLEPAELLSVEEACRILRIGRSRGYAMAASGEMPGVLHLGRAVRVSRRHLLRWIDELATEHEKGANAASAAPWEMSRATGHTPTSRS